MKPSDIIKNFPEIVIGLLVIGTTIVVFIEIIFRYFLNFSLGWSEELSKNFFIWMSFLGAAICIKKGMHFSFPIFLHRTPKKTQIIIEVLNNSLIIGFSIILFYTGLQSFKQSFKQTFIALNISYAWLYSVIPISAVLMVIYLIQKIVKIIKESELKKMESGG